MNIQIKYAVKEDIPIINSLTKEMHKYLGKLVRLNFSEKELKGEEVNASELRGIFVAYDLKAKKVVGYISFSPKPEKDEWYGRHIYMYEFAVTKEYRGKGIGQMLINKLIELCEKKKLNLKVDSLVKNKKTVEFYKKMGFEPLSIYFVKRINK